MMSTKGYVVFRSNARLQTCANSYFQVSLQGNLEGILFYHELIRVFDEVDLDSL
jgi:hypothetical protein